VRIAPQLKLGVNASSRPTPLRHRDGGSKAGPDVHRGIRATMSRPTENVDEDQVVRSAGGDFGLRRLSRRILKRQPAASWRLLLAIELLLPIH